MELASILLIHIKINTQMMQIPFLAVKMSSSIRPVFPRGQIVSWHCE
jgi:hypothetical protein